MTQRTVTVTSEILSTTPSDSTVLVADSISFTKYQPSRDIFALANVTKGDETTQVSISFDIKNLCWAVCYYSYDHDTNTKNHYMDFEKAASMFEQEVGVKIPRTKLKEMVRVGRNNKQIELEDGKKYHLVDHLGEVNRYASVTAKFKFGRMNLVVESENDPNEKMEYHPSCIDVVEIE
ncbi:hypothetical protein [Aeromonas veronii]|uniref:Uncharacterized protein n=1 Tax=Aeromonas veronii TaxID=654 RepID=A0A2T4MWZ1_AERVE|nr:hypothetical protein [Aeromonas veronii]PTH79103.1 hypothetical protein DAA48_21940 [Aeromonas veronii]